MKDKLRCSKAAVIPAGIDLELFKPMSQQECRQLLDLSTPKKLILWVGEYLRQEKRFDLVTEAVTRLQQRVPDAEFVLVTGKPHSLIPLYMNACDVLLLVSDAEGSPNVVKEAMACNLPIVSVPVGDVPDIIKGTEGCFMCTQNAVDVAEKLELALLRMRRTTGREKVMRFELGQTSRRIIQVYWNALADRKKRVKGWPKKMARHE
jgi:glycosyltransferase involved in cell wall biosynthesis